MLARVGNVLVTGATGGIGSAIVAALLSEGHQVTALGRDISRLGELAASGAQTVAADLTQVESLSETVSELPAPDALVHCAGISEIATVADAEPAVWVRTLTVNVAAAAELTRVMLPALRDAHGHVVFVNASPGMRAVPRWASFVGSKAALRELADSLRDEEAANGVKVTTVYPSGTATERLRGIRAAFGREYDPAHCIQPETLATMIVWLLAAPPDAYVSELAVSSSPHSRP
jgi:NADP-dependent 3-hydroxy acid dehydrogenase YdfG